MTDDRIEGTLRKGAGHVQDAVGGLTGDGETQARGKLNQAAGSAQDALGKIKDQAGDLYGQAADQAQDVYAEVERFVQERPLAAVGLGVIVGLVLGAAMRGPTKTVYVRR